jgi:hypothetical protein
MKASEEKVKRFYTERAEENRRAQRKRERSFGRLEANTPASGGRRILRRIASGLQQMGFGGGEEDLELRWIWKGALGEVFGAAAFAGKLFESFAEGGADVLR